MSWDDGDQSVFDVNNEAYEREEGRIFSRISAAAPELLEALEILLAAQPSEAITEPLRSAIVNAVCAVKKAKGDLK